MWGSSVPAMPAMNVAPASSKMPPRIFQGFQAVLTAGQATLSNTSIVTNASMSEAEGGLLLEARIAYEHSGHSSLLLEQVKAALMAASETSEGVYILGYECEPFEMMTTEWGFKAWFATVLEESSACWDLLSQGYCKRGCSCRWSHPEFQVPISVKISIAA